MLKNLSARARIVLLVILSALPVLGLAVYNSVQQRRAAEIAEDQHLQLIAGLAARRPEQIIEGARLFLYAMTSDIDNLTHDRRRCVDQFRRAIREVHGQFRTMGVVLPNGEIFCDATDSQLRTNVMDRDYFQMAVNSGKFSVGGYQVGRRTGLPAINMAYPVLDSTNRVIAVAYAALNLGIFEEQSELNTDSKLGTTRVINIMDREGVVLGQFPPRAAKVGERGCNEALIKAMLGQKSGTLKLADAEGDMRLYSFSAVGRNPDDKPALYVVISSTIDTVYASADDALRRSVKGIAIVSTLLLLLAWFGAEIIITRRFRVLLAVTDRIRAGDFSARNGFGEGNEELTRLGAAFDIMAGQLETRDAQLQEALARMRDQAITDELTGLFNRRHLWTALEGELARARRRRAPIAVLLFDIDHFKQLNDRWGHEAGDLVLQGISQVVLRVVRGTDIVARHGGEEFVVVMPEAGEEVAQLRARELRARVADMHLSYQGQALGTVTVSVGVVVSGDASQSGDALVREADAAMYEAKTRGRDQIVLRRLGTAS